MPSQSYTYRVRGIPSHSSAKSAKELLESILGADGRQSRPSIKSFAPDPSRPLSLATKVATVNFEKVPDILRDKRREWVFTVPVDESIDDGMQPRQVKVIIDSHFEGFTPLNALRSVKDHKVDCIAIPGLGGHAFGSWKEKDGEHMWLRDSLPEDFSGARILTYGYNSELVGSTSFQGIEALASQFIAAIGRVRQTVSDQDRPRPLIFIAHSLGGLVLKQALVRMVDGNPVDRENFYATYGALFFGVPNRGLRTEYLRAIVKNQPNEGLVVSLDPESDFLRRLHEDFCSKFRFRDSRIISFYETGLSPTPKRTPDGEWERTGEHVRLVDQSSATGSLPMEPFCSTQAINRNHSEMVKFSAQDIYYNNVLYHLYEFKDATTVVELRFSDLKVRKHQLLQNVPAPFDSMGRMDTETTLEGSHQWLDNNVQSGSELILSNEMSMTQGLSVADIYGAYTDRNCLPDKESRQALRCLWTVDPRSDLLAAVEKHEPLTGNWVFERKEFTEWRQTPNSFLWLYGIPGCGKTILSSTIINKLQYDCVQEPKVIVAYFFFDFRDKDRQTVRNFLSSIICQICFRRRRIPDSIRALFDHPRIQQQLPTTHDLLACLAAAAKGLRVFLISDALDECTERSTLLRVLIKIASAEFGSISVLATSRREGDIAQSLEPILTGSICLQNTFVEADIYLFIRKRIAETPKMRRWPKSLKEDTQKKLMDGAQGMFRWVDCQLDPLLKCSTQNDVEKALQTLPKTLEDTYDRMLLSIPTIHHEKVKRTLYFLVFSVRPLSFREAVEAAVVKPGCRSFGPKDRLFDPEDIVEMCSNLVSLSEDTSTLKLAHNSVREYLTSDHVRKGPASFFSVCEISANMLIAEVCLTYLLLFDGATPLTGESLQEFPLLDYAAKHWTEHTKNVTQEPSQSALASLSAELLGSREKPAFINWLHVFEPDRPWLSFNPQKDPGTFALPLCYAAYCGLLETTRVLLRCGASAGAEEGGDRNPLHGAAQRGNKAIIQLLLGENINIDGTNFYGETALHEAVSGGYVESVMILLEHNAFVDCQNMRGETPLHKAAAAGHEEISELLLAFLADVGAMDDCDRTPLHLAAFNGRQRIAKLLLDSDAVVNMQDNSGRTALHEAVYRGSEEMTGLLLQRGAEIEARNKGGWTALHQAAWLGNNALVKSLLDSQANSEVQDFGGGSALHLAAYRGHETVVQMLLEYGADIEAKAVVELEGVEDEPEVEARLTNGRTAMHDAAWSGQDAVVRLLLQHGASIETKDEKGYTALDRAARNGHEGVVKLLKNHVV
ncbi:MAG: hypothetical protein M1839_009511 [Geoglossum umbratile]|nr:MAG: hypothetical protein M1839_009511 [Geoglossum umbratile]